MEALCCELDDVTVHYFEILQQLSMVKQDMEISMQQGFMNLSKARNAMGRGQVGSLQFDQSKMSAQAMVYLSQDQDDKSYTDFQVEHEKELELKTTKIAHCSDVKKPREIPELKSQKKVSRKHCTDPSTSKEQHFVHQQDEGKPVCDPLRWFGILVPSNLRQCQSNFVQALHICSKVACLQSRLDSVKCEYARLQKKKKQVKDASTSDSLQ
ncbi:coiled-coil domain-containing protein 115-like [Asterias rubens]|uniref:coiled-coil domain-containing protein 115-like n=1 Tax=Asterias rubens TaxID=7604 RepID=UPI001454E489|nr:coiled-coil domain-containing protein 115-like [Asterias rubens]